MRARMSCLACHPEKAGTASPWGIKLLILGVESLGQAVFQGWGR